LRATDGRNELRVQSMEISPQQKGKRGEFFVFGELIKRGFDLYLPVVDVGGIDAILRLKSGKCIEMQVKSTEAKKQAGYFNVYDLEPRPNLFIPESSSNLPVISGTATLTRYAILEQNLLQRPSRKIFWGLEIPVDVDHVCVAFKEMEAFVRALATEKNVPVTVDILRMTDKPAEWPEGIGFLEVRNFPLCSSKWEPVDHLKDPKNRVRMAGTISTSASDLTDLVIHRYTL
jgi:hypothetical protein